MDIRSKIERGQIFTEQLHFLSNSFLIPVVHCTPAMSLAHKSKLFTRFIHLLPVQAALTPPPWPPSSQSCASSSQKPHERTPKEKSPPTVDESVARTKEIPSGCLPLRRKWPTASCTLPSWGRTIRPRSLSPEPSVWAKPLVPIIYPSR